MRVVGDHQRLHLRRRLLFVTTLPITVVSFTDRCSVRYIDWYYVRCAARRFLRDKNIGSASGNVHKPRSDDRSLEERFLRFDFVSGFDQIFAWIKVSCRKLLQVIFVSVTALLEWVSESTVRAYTTLGSAVSYTNHARRDRIDYAVVCFIMHFS